MKPTEFIRENGWLLFVQRAGGAALRRLRDAMIARKLRSPGFRCGRHPRLLGLAHMQIGSNFNAGDNLWLEAVTEYAGQHLSPAVTIGDNVSVSDGVHIACTHEVSIGAGTLIGSRVILSDHEHGVYSGPSQSPPDSIPARRSLSTDGSVIVGRNVWIGDGVAVLNGARIGDGCIIGANSVVSREIPGGSIAVGAPARVIRRWSAETGTWLPIEAAHV